MNGIDLHTWNYNLIFDGLNYTYWATSKQNKFKSQIEVWIQISRTNLNDFH